MWLLSEDLQFWRAERPDEWIMDRFIQKAIEMEKDLELLDELIECKRSQISALEDILKDVRRIVKDALDGIE